MRLTHTISYRARICIKSGAVHETPGKARKSLLIFPNPAANWLTLKSDPGMAADWVVRYKFQASAVWQGSPAGTGIDVGYLPTGLYILKARWKDGGLYFDKVVVQVEKK